jgi:3-hydroxymyristoyl/3-hydroxydecanoyl-(acyl carrier protein) dehydratase
MLKPFMQKLTQLSCAAGQITASARVPADSVWYAGHFPGNPILPGIAVLALVEEAILTAEQKEKRQVLITGIGRVRFRLPVKPDDWMTLKISREIKQDRLTYEFSVCLAEELACTGFFRARIATV